MSEHFFFLFLYSFGYLENSKLNNCTFLQRQELLPPHCTIFHCWLLFFYLKNYKWDFNLIFSIAKYQNSVLLNIIVFLNFNSRLILNFLLMLIMCQLLIPVNLMIKLLVVRILLGIDIEWLHHPLIVI